MPKTEYLPVAEHFPLFVPVLMNEASDEFLYGGISVFLGFNRTGPLVDSEVTDCIRGTGIQAAATGFTDTNLLGDRLIC